MVGWRLPTPLTGAHHLAKLRHEGRATYLGAHRRSGNRRSDRHRPFRENRTSHDATEGSSTVTVHVYRAEEGGFWAEMPEYPGCYTQGETMDEFKENVREAVQCYIDAGYADQRTTKRTEKPEILQVAL